MAFQNFLHAIYGLPGGLATPFHPVGGKSGAIGGKKKRKKKNYQALGLDSGFPITFEFEELPSIKNTKARNEFNHKLRILLIAMMEDE